jgi:type II secretory pathway pseudopilin PulG
MTMLELMIVLVIISVLTAIAIPNFAAYQAQEQAKSNVQIVASALREARTAALRTGTEYIVLFNPDADTLVRVFRDRNGDRKQDAGDVVEDITLSAVRREGVNPWGVDDSPFPDAPRAYNDPLEPGLLLGVGGDIVDGADFREHWDRGIPAVGFTSRGIPFEVTGEDTTPEIGSGGGAFYMTDGRGGLFAAILMPLGEVRVRAYDPNTQQWR